jgi:hypothetical protein
MEHIAQLIFFINLAWIMTHELDAIQHHEWRILPLTSWMSEVWGYRVFIVAHIPLFVMLMVFSTDHQFQIILDIFLIIHVGLHWFFRNHPENTFDNRLSQGLIIGGAPLGILHMSLILM